MKSQPQLTEQSWWNKPLFGSVSLWQRLWGALKPQPIPELAVSLHNTELEELNNIAPTIKMLDNEQYSSEYVFYRHIKYKLDHNLDEYKGLNTFVKIFSFTINNIKYFSVVRRIELDFQGSTLNGLYEFVQEQLSITNDTHLFHKLVNGEINRLLKLVRNEPTKNAILTYKNALFAISQNEMGLNLLSLFKKYNISDFSTFKILNDILKQLKNQDLENLKALVLVVKVNYEQLDKLGNLFGIPPSDDQVIIYAKILQYIALTSRYENINYRFEKLLDILKKWNTHYQTLKEIREQYPAYKYKVPSEFLQEVGGESIYAKYESLMKLSNTSP